MINEERCSAFSHIDTSAHIKMSTDITICLQSELHGVYDCLWIGFIVALFSCLDVRHHLFQASSVNNCCSFLLFFFVTRLRANFTLGSHTQAPQSWDSGHSRLLGSNLPSSMTWEQSSPLPPSTQETVSRVAGPFTHAVLPLLPYYIYCIKWSCILNWAYNYVSDE